MCLYLKLIKNPKYRPNKKTTTIHQYVKMREFYMYQQVAEIALNAETKKSENGRQE